MWYKPQVYSTYLNMKTKLGMIDWWEIFLLLIEQNFQTAKIWIRQMGRISPRTSGKRPIIATKAMRNSEIYAITCYAEFPTSRIPTVRNLTEINLISENPELRGNVTEILKELRNFRY